MFSIPSAKQDLIQVTVYVDNYPLAMELDTGASLSIISKTVYQNLLSAPKLEPTSAQLTIYTSESIKLLGSILVNIMCATMVKKVVYLY